MNLVYYKALMKYNNYVTWKDFESFFLKDIIN